MFREVREEFHVEGSLINDGVKMKESVPAPVIDFPLMRIAREMNAGKTINVDELDAPLFNTTKGN